MNRKLVSVDSYRPTRYSVRVGDPVYVRLPRKRSFAARVCGIRADAITGEVVEVDVVGAKGDRVRSVRTFTPDHITRLSQRVAERRGV